MHNALQKFQFALRAAARVHLDRTLGGNRDHRDSGRNVVARLVKGQGQSPGDKLYEQWQATYAGVDSIHGG